MAAVDRAAIAVVAFLCASPAAAFSFDDAGAPSYERCALCHGLFGNSPRQKFPRLAGQRAAYIEKQIHAFLDGARRNDGGQMVAIVTELTPEQIPEAAQWFADQPHPAPAPLTEGAEGGAYLWAISGCGDCHAENEKDDPDMPWLSAQHPVYLSKQMHDLREGRRPGDAKGRMQAQLRTLDAPKIEILAAWLASRGRGE